MYFILGLGIVMIGVIAWYRYRQESKVRNSGVSLSIGASWVCEGSDSQGGVLYSDGYGNSFWSGRYK